MDEARAPVEDGSAWVPFVRPRIEAADGLSARIERILRSGRLSNNGPNLLQFESAIAKYLDVEQAVVVSNASDGLMLSCRALGLAGKVVLPAFTYIATLSAFANNGLTPVFCDID